MWLDAYRVPEQAQPALTALFQLLSYAWALVTDQRPCNMQENSYRQGNSIDEQDLIKLGDLSWLAAALAWGPACATAAAAAWSGAICQVNWFHALQAA